MRVAQLGHEHLHFFWTFFFQHLPLLAFFTHLPGFLSTQPAGGGAFIVWPGAAGGSVGEEGGGGGFGEGGGDGIVVL